MVPEAVGMHLGSATHGHRSAWQRRHAGFARGYLLRRYGVLRGRQAPRALATEAAVALGDALVSRDLAAALRTSRRLALGARACSAAAAPAAALDPEIGLRDSLALRTSIYGRR